MWFKSETREAPRFRLLLVEDSETDLLLIRESFHLADLDAAVLEAHSGDAAISFFRSVDMDETTPCPDLVLLDINLPGRHGPEVLQHMRCSRRCSKAPVLVVTSSDSRREHEEMTRLGANAFFRKSYKLSEFLSLGQVVKDLLAACPDKV